ncbi:MAG TPA: tetratricopeptide repeat protein [Capsulimonadaceae bacterium]|jgi:tetratricopeptide (TPR) repeat protein
MDSTDQQVKSSLRFSIVAIILCCLLVYGRTASFDFIWYDDQVHLFQNPYLTPPTWDSVVHLWREPYEKLYIPLSYTVFALLCVIGRLPQPVAGSDSGALLDPHVFHAANIVLHTANALLVFWIIRRWVKRDIPAVIGTLLFAVHPFQVESVAWISELRGLLAALLSLASIVLYIAGRKGDTAGAIRPAFYIGATLLFVAALLAKPSAVVTPLLALLIDYMIEPRPWRVYAKQLGPWLAISLLLVLVTRGAQPVPSYAQVGILYRPLIAGDALAFYLIRLIAPIQMSMDYSRTPHAVLASHQAYFDWLIPVTVAIGCVLARKKYPWLALSGLVMVAGLLPVLGLVPFVFQTTSTVADRYMYLAMIGPAIILAILTSKMSQRTMIGACVWLVLLSGASVWRAEAWQNSRALWARELPTHPDSPFIFIGIGHSLMFKGDYAAALAQFQIATKNHPISPDAYFNLGSAYEALGKLDDADAAYQIAISQDTSYGKGYMNLGNTQLTRGNVLKAMEWYDKAHAVTPKLPRLNYNVGNAFMAAGKNDEALAAFQREIVINQDFAPSYVNAAIILANANRLQEAADMMTKAISVGAPKASWYSNLAYIHARLGKVDDARREAQEALKLDPKDEAAAYILKSLSK